MSTIMQTPQSSNKDFKFGFIEEFVVSVNPTTPWVYNEDGDHWANSLTDARFLDDDSLFIPTADDNETAKNMQLYGCGITPIGGSWNVSACAIVSPESVPTGTIFNFRFFRMGAVQ